MSKIDDFTLSYNISKRYVVNTFKKFYSEFIIIGKENIPVQGPVIFAPNHLGALMDALAILAITPHRMPVVFIARSDIFNNNFAVKVLRFVKILPAFRIRDGFKNVEKNNDIFEQCVDVLLNKNAIGIMPEGNQGEERNIRQLVKGIFRIAFAAQEKMNNSDQVKIIPVGIDMGSIEKFRKHIIINIGQPINVADYINRYEENQAVTINEIKNRLKNDLENLTVNLATSTYYNCMESITSIATEEVINQKHLIDTTSNRFIAQQEIGKKLVNLEREHAETFKTLEPLCNEYNDLLKEINLPSYIFDKAPSKIINLIFNSLILLITLPIFICGFLLNFFALFIPLWIRKSMKVKYTGFYSSLHYVLGILFSFPVFYTLNTILFGCITSSPWWVLILFFLSQYLLGDLAYRWFEEAKKNYNQLCYKYFTCRKNKIIQQIKSLRKKIIDLALN